MRRDFEEEIVYAKVNSKTQSSTSYNITQIYDYEIHEFFL